MTVSPLTVDGFPTNPGRFPHHGSHIPGAAPTCRPNGCTERNGSVVRSSAPPLLRSPDDRNGRWGSVDTFAPGDERGAHQ